MTTNDRNPPLWNEMVAALHQFLSRSLPPRRKEAEALCILRKHDVLRLVDVSSEEQARALIADFNKAA
jgi:hypothetical protein